MLLRQANSGQVVRGNADGDALLWNAAAAEWFPGTAGGLLVPLSNTFYVDPGSAAATPDGSIGKPYPSLQAAFDARKAISPLALVCCVGVVGDLVIPTDPALVGNALLLIGEGAGGGNLNAVGPTCTVTCGVTGTYTLAAQNMNIQTMRDGQNDPPRWAGPIVLDSCTGNDWNTLAATIEVSGCYLSGTLQCAELVASQRNELGHSIQAGLQLIEWSSETEQSTFGNRDIPVATFTIAAGTVLNRVDDAAPTGIVADDVDQPSGAGSRLVFPPGRLTANRTVTLTNPPNPVTPSSTWIDVWPQAHDLIVVDQLHAGSTMTVPANSGAVRLVWSINTNDVTPTWTPVIVQPLA